MDDERKWPIISIFVDILLLSAVVVSAELLKIYGNIQQSGFYCNDLSIMYPMADSSIDHKTRGVIEVVGTVINIFAMCCNEYLHNRGNKAKIRLGKYNVRTIIHQFYSVILPFGFGYFVSLFVTITLKNWLGIKRPYFLAACAPNINCSLPENQNVYHVNYTCTNEEVSKNSTWCSFPSGHTASATYFAVFLVIYIQNKVHWKMPTLLKASCQFILIMLPVYVGLWRIHGRHHHWDDVIGGLVIGASSAALVSNHMYKEQ